MKKTMKDFDCVQMMHDGALRIHEELKVKSREERLAYWRAQDEEMRRKYPRMRYTEDRAKQ